MVELSFFKYRGFWWENGGRVAGLVDSLRIRLQVDLMRLGKMVAL